MHDSPEKHNFLSPEKTGIKGSELYEDNTVSKLYLDQPVDIEARGVSEEDGKVTEDENEQEHTTPKIDKDQRKETIKQNLDKLGFKVKGPKMFKRDKTRKKQFDMQEALDKIQ